MKINGRSYGAHRARRIDHSVTHSPQRSLSQRCSEASRFSWGVFMPGIDYHELRARVSMRAVLALLGFQPTQIRGVQLRGPCPLHGPSSE